MSRRGADVAGATGVGVIVALGVVLGAGAVTVIVGAGAGVGGTDTVLVTVDMTLGVVTTGAGGTYVALSPSMTYTRYSNAKNVVSENTLVLSRPTSVLRICVSLATSVASIVRASRQGVYTESIRDVYCACCVVSSDTNSLSNAAMLVRGSTHHTHSNIRIRYFIVIDKK